MIHVIAHIQLQPGIRAEFLKQFLWVTPQVRAEAGCLEYGATIDVATPLAIQERVGDDAVIVVEKWASVEALVAHTKAPHMGEYRERVKDFVKGVKLQITQPVE